MRMRVKRSMKPALLHICLGRVKNEREKEGKRAKEPDAECTTGIRQISDEIATKSNPFRGTPLGQQYPFPCCTHLGNQKYEQQG